MNQDPIFSPRFPVLIPDLGTGTDPIRFLIGLVHPGASVIPGERIAELLVQGTVFQLDADREGVLDEWTRFPGEQILPGEIIAYIRSDGTSV